MNPSRWNSHGNAIKGLQRQMRPSFARSDTVLALRKAVPSMEGGFIINTVFRDVSFDGADAEAIACFVRALLQAKLGGTTGAHSADGRSVEPRPGKRSR